MGLARIIDLLLRHCASLRLAIGVIVSLALYLAAGTIYESRYGAAATQLMVYQSPIFFAILGLLALNVFAAAVVRFPWKRHQTGFLITHIGIEVLLLGWLIGGWYGLDGRMILRVGEAANAIQLPSQHLAYRSTSDASAEWQTVSLQPFVRAALPSVPRFLFRDIWSAHPGRFESSGKRTRIVTAGAEAIDVIEWQPAIEFEGRYVEEPLGIAAAQARIFGTTPEGLAVDETAWFTFARPAELFGGIVRLRFATGQPNLSPARGELVMMPAGDRWRAGLFSSGRVLNSFDVQLGEERAAWMNLKLVIKSILNHAKMTEIITPLRMTGDRIDSATPGLRVFVRKNFPGQYEGSTHWLIRGAEPKKLGTVELAYGLDATPLPLEIRLAAARGAITNRETSSATISIVHSPDLATAEREIAPNRPIKVDGHAIYLLSVEQTATGPAAILSVRRDPGSPWKYAGSALIVLGTLLMFLIRKRRTGEAGAAVSQPVLDVRKPAAQRPAWVLLLIVFCAAGSARAAVDVEPLRAVPVHYADRVQPLDSMAREVVRTIRGRETSDATRTLVDWAANPAAAEQTAILDVPNLAIRARLGLPADQKYIAPAKLRNAAATQWLAGLAAREQRMNDRGEISDFTAEEIAGLALRHRLRVFDSIADRSVFQFTTAGGATANARVVDEILTVASSSDATAGGAIATIAGVLQAPLSPPERNRLAREVRYNAIHPFRWVLMIYGAALLTMAVWRVRNQRTIWNFAAGLMLLAVAAHAGAFAWRCSITGWAPVTNMYETIVWVGGVAAVMGVVVAMMTRGRLATVGGAVVATLACVVGDVMPPELGRSIDNLAPVLRSNLWLTIHVLTVVSSYAAFSVAAVLANVALWRFGRGNSSAAGEIALPMYRLIQIGIVLIAAGTALGAMWADVSWGRFWGWDPKEVWALVVLLSYLAILHGKSAGWVGPFGLAAWTIIAFLTVLMSWYGVNFVLGVGLHSYGFGAGGIEYVLSYVILQLGFVIWARARYRTQNPTVSMATAITQPATAAAER